MKHRKKTEIGKQHVRRALLEQLERRELLAADFSLANPDADLHSKTEFRLDVRQSAKQPPIRPAHQQSSSLQPMERPRDRGGPMGLSEPSWSIDAARLGKHNHKHSRVFRQSSGRAADTIEITSPLTFTTVAVSKETVEANRPSPSPPRLISSRLSSATSGPLPENAVRISPQLPLSSQSGHDGSTSDAGFVLLDLNSRPPQAFFVPPTQSALDSGSQKELSSPSGAEAEGESQERTNTATDLAIEELNAGQPKETESEVSQEQAEVSVDSRSETYRRIRALSRDEFSRFLVKRIAELRVSDQKDPSRLSLYEGLLADLWASDEATEQQHNETISRLQLVLANHQGEASMTSFLRVEGMIALDVASDDLEGDARPMSEFVDAIAAAWDSPIASNMLDNWAAIAVGGHASSELLSEREVSSLVTYRPIVASITAVAGVGIVAYTRRRREKSLDTGNAKI